MGVTIGEPHFDPKQMVERVEITDSLGRRVLVQQPLVVEVPDVEHPVHGTVAGTDIQLDWHEAVIEQAARNHQAQADRFAQMVRARALRLRMSPDKVAAFLDESCQNCSDTPRNEQK